MIDHKRLAKISPQHYGEVNRNIWPMAEPHIVSVEEMAAENNLGAILFRQGVWCVTTDGIECLSMPYHIDASRFTEQNWVSHVCEKTWVIKPDFIQVWQKALEIHNQEEFSNE